MVRSPLCPDFLYPKEQARFISRHIKVYRFFGTHSPSHREALNYLVAKQACVYAIITNSSYVFKNTNKEVGEQTTQIFQQAPWLKEMASQSLAPEVWAQIKEIMPPLVPPS